MGQATVNTDSSYHIANQIPSCKTVVSFRFVAVEHSFRSETNRSDLDFGIEGETKVAERSGVSVLVVDDLVQWRDLLRAVLRAKLGLYIVEEAANGLEAVEKAANMQPDLVILDIGLPKLNGIEVARQIRNISSESRIVFLTENDSCDVAEAALNSGAKGYVIKSAFASELVPAVEALMEGQSFLSAKLVAQGTDFRSKCDQCSGYSSLPPNQTIAPSTGVSSRSTQQLSFWHGEFGEGVL